MKVLYSLPKNMEGEVSSSYYYKRRNIMKIYYDDTVYVPVQCSMSDDYAGNVYIVRRKMKKAEDYEKLEKVFRILNVINKCDCWVIVSAATEAIEKNGRWERQESVKLTVSFKSLQSLEEFSNFVEREL